MTRDEQPRTDIDIEIGPAHDGERRHHPIRVAAAAAVTVAIGTFAAGYATHAGVAEHQPGADAAPTTAPVTDSTYAPIHLPPDGGADGGVFLGPYPRRLEPPYCTQPDR